MPDVTFVDRGQLLRERGLQVTAQRVGVLRAVSERPHATPDELIQAVREQLGAVSRQAVYDVLAVLTEKGLVRRIQTAGSSALYEARVGDNHHHLICRSCRRVVDVECATATAPCLDAADDHGYEIDEAEIVYWGRCPDCRSADAPTSSKRPPVPAAKPTGVDPHARRS